MIEQDDQRMYASSQTKNSIVMIATIYEFLSA